MTTKPATLPRWANVGGAIVTPSSGELDVGNLPGAIPPAQKANWHPNLVGQWITWLNALATTGGGATDNLDTSGNVNVGGTLGVGGLTTIANNQNVLLQGTGYVRHGTRTLILHGAAFSWAGAAGSVSATYVAGGSLAAIDGIASVSFQGRAAVPLLAGNRVLAIRLNGLISNSDTQIQMKLDTVNPTTDAFSTVATSAASTGSAGTKQVTLTGLTQTISATNVLSISAISSGAAHIIGVISVEIDFDTP